MTIKAFTFVQSTPAATWNITHPFDDTPVGEVTIVLNGVTTKIHPTAIRYVSSSQMEVRFSAPIIGEMRLVGNILNASSGTAGAGSIDPGQTA